MNLNQTQLSNHLQQGLKPAYLVSGDEPLLVQECCDAIRSACRQQGFTEREVFDIDGRFNWDNILHSLNSMSLFADRKLLELRFATSSIGDSGSKGLQAVVENLNPDTLILVNMPRIDKATQNNKWFKALDNIGASIQVWPVERNNLPRWIQGRMQERGLNASPDALQFLADNVEGNLLAAQQEIEKLQLLVGDSRSIDLDTITRLVSNSSRYTVFNLTDRCLAGDTDAALRTFNGLKAEGMEATLMLWSLTRELRVLHRIHSATRQGTALFQAMQNERISQNRQPLVQNALQRLAPGTIEKMLIKARLIDQSIKGMADEPPWMLLEQMTMAFSSRQ